MNLSCLEMKSSELPHWVSGPRALHLLENWNFATLFCPCCQLEPDFLCSVSAISASKWRKENTYTHIRICWPSDRNDTTGFKSYHINLSKKKQSYAIVFTSTLCPEVPVRHPTRSFGPFSLKSPSLVSSSTHSSQV